MNANNSNDNNNSNENNNSNKTQWTIEEACEIITELVNKTNPLVNEFSKLVDKYSATVELTKEKAQEINEKIKETTKLFYDIGRNKKQINILNNKTKGLDKLLNNHKTKNPNSSNELNRIQVEIEEIQLSKNKIEKTISDSSNKIIKNKEYINNEKTKFIKLIDQIDIDSDTRKKQGEIVEKSFIRTINEINDINKYQETHSLPDEDNNSILNLNVLFSESICIMLSFKSRINEMIRGAAVIKKRRDKILPKIETINSNIDSYFKNLNNSLYSPKVCFPSDVLLTNYMGTINTNMQDSSGLAAASPHNISIATVSTAIIVKH